MGRYVLTGDDTLVINQRPIVDLADGDVITITVDNDISSTQVGKNKNMIIAKDEQGNLGTITLRLLKGSADDRFLQTYYQTYEADSALFIIGEGNFSKRLGDGQGNVLFDNYVLSGLHFNRKPTESTWNVNGATEQAVTVYQLRALINRRVG